MKKYLILVLALVLTVPLVWSPVSAQAESEKTISPGIDATVSINFDSSNYTVDQYKNPLETFITIDPTGRNDSWGGPGVIEESRSVVEFNISDIADSGFSSVASAKLYLTFAGLFQNASELQYNSIQVLVGGYAGDGAIGGIYQDGTGERVEASVTTFPADFTPSSITWLSGPLQFIAATPVGTLFEVDATQFINSLLASQKDWAGFILTVDPSSLPARPWSPALETRFGVFFGANGTSGQPSLKIRTSSLPTDDIQSIASSLDTLKTGGVLTVSQVDELDNKLDAALAMLESSGKNKTKTAVNQINAFINNVKSYINQGYLTQEQGNSLINAAKAIINALQP